MVGPILGTVGLVLDIVGVGLLAYDVLFNFELTLPTWLPKRMSEVDEGQTVLFSRRIPTYTEKSVRGLRWRSRSGLALIAIGFGFQIAGMWL